MALPFFFGGYYSKSGFIESANSMKMGTKLSLFGICMGILYLILLYNGRVSMQQLLFGNAPSGINVLLFYIGGFVGTIMILMLSSCISHSIKVIEYVSSSLITVVGTQSLFIKYYKQFFGFNQSWIIIIMAASIIIVMCVLFHFLLIKYFPMLYKQR